MKKNALLLTVSALAISLLLAGCGKNEPVAPEYTKAANGAEVITEDTAKRYSTGSQKINYEDATFISVELDDGNKYEVEFIYDGYKYKVDIDAETGDVKEVEKEIVDVAVDVNKNDIGRDAALNAALTKAGLEALTEADLTYCEIKLDDEDGRLEYEIEFVYGEKEYEVTVSAEDGSIIKYEQSSFIKYDDDDDDRYDDDDDNDYDDDDDEGAVSGEDCIGEDAALAIALEHASLSKEDISGLRIKLEIDDGKKEYEIEFVNGYDEYDYDIDAVSGEILNFDREGEHASAPDFSMPSDDELISYDEAKAAAIAHANVSEADVYDFEIELDRDKGEVKYEIEFSCNGCDYEYDIDAVDGSVIRYNSEIDD